MNEARVVRLTEDLVRFPSVSSRSNVEVSDYVADILSQHRFEIERIDYLDPAGVTKSNLIAKRGVGQGGIAYLAHTDVVPADDWVPEVDEAFRPKRTGDRLYGRGTCDMKGSLAAALTAMQLVDESRQQAPLYFVVTADEEAGMEGAQIIRRDSQMFRSMTDTGCVGIVGEPTCLNVIYSHKGTLVLTIRSEGKSAHSSSRNGVNANDKLFRILPELSGIRDNCESNLRYHNSLFDPPTLSWNWVIRNEPFAANVTTGLAELRIFIRPMPDVDHEQIVQQVSALVENHGLILRKSAGTMPLTGNPESAFVRGMLDITGTQKPLTACYATDGGVLQDLREIVVCGPGDIAQAHCNDEWVSVGQLGQAVEVYRRAFERFCYG